MKPKLYRALRRKMHEMDIDQVYLAKALDMAPMSLSARMTGRTDWRLAEMYAVLDVVREPHSKIYEYFPPFGKEVEVTKETVSAKSELVSQIVALVNAANVQ